MEGTPMARKSRALEKQFHELCLPHAFDLRHPDPDVRAGAAEALGRLADYAGIVVPALATGCGDPDVEVRSACAHALGVIGEEVHRDMPGTVPVLDEAVPVLTAALGDGSAAVRRRAACALGAVGPAAAGAAAGLRGLLADPDGATRAAAAAALERLAPDPDAGGAEPVPRSPGGRPGR
jgi:HEAT repeat protein